MIEDCSKIFNGLIGQWQIHRTITPGGVFEGRGIFTALSDTSLSYSEEGQLTLADGTVLEPRKAYEWRLEEGQIVIYFADGETKGQVFHQLNFADAQNASAAHWCDPDTYQSGYVFDLPHSFSITHNVQGPKKSYVSTSHFTPIK